MIDNYYLTGKLFKKMGHIDIAITHYEFSAIEGNIKAQNELGDIYSLYYIYHDFTDYKKSFKWFKKSADQGNAKGQFNIGVQYRYGEGVKQSNKESLFWLEKAANQGYEKAIHHLGSSYSAVGEVGYNGIVEQDFDKAVEWYEKSSDRSEVEFCLTRMHMEGLTTPQSAKIIYKYLISAANDHDVEIQYHLGMMFKNGDRIGKDIKKALKWLNKAASRGHRDAIKELEYRAWISR